MDLILRSIVKRCVSKDGSNARTRGHPSRRIASARLLRMRVECVEALDLPLDHLQLEFGNGLGGIEALRAGLGAVHDGVAAIEPERILEIVEPLAGGLIAAVLDPARRLQQGGRAEIAVAVPPVARARGRAAGAQNTLIKTV